MSKLREQLDAMAAHVRDPGTHPGPPGIEARRLKIYSDLVYNNLDGLLAGNFPVIRKTLGDADWKALVRGFLARHHNHTPLFTELGRELIAFLEAFLHFYGIRRRVLNLNRADFHRAVNSFRFLRQGLGCRFLLAFF